MNQISSGAAAFLLPQLDPNRSELRPGKPGEWTIHPPITYQTIAQSLDLGGAGSAERSVTSIPNIWARALLLETALHNLNYPRLLRNALIEQWEGMLAAIALAEVRQFNIKVQPIVIEDKDTSNPLELALNQLLPEPAYCIYCLNEQPLSNYNPWRQFYVILWDDKPVGLTSPSTLICPSEAGRWVGLPWYDDQEKLVSPVSASSKPFLNAIEKDLLAKWLINLAEQLENYRGVQEARSMTKRLLENFSNKLTQAPKQELAFSNNKRYFGTEVRNRGAIDLLFRPIKAPEQQSSITLLPSTGVQPTKQLLIIDPELPVKWHEQPQNIWINERVTMASRTWLEDVKASKFANPGNNKPLVEWIDAEELLLPDLSFIGLEKALPPALLPKGTESLVFEGKSITPLLPVNPRLLDYLTPEDLVEKLKFEADGINVTVTLELPLSGFPNESPKTYYCEREYTLKPERQLNHERPILEIWPNFRFEGWKDYHAIYYGSKDGKNTYRVKLPHQIGIHAFEDRDNRAYCQLIQLSSFPTFIQCESVGDKPQILGIILLKPPEILRPIIARKWKIGVDFGTSFTNIFYNNNQGTVEKLPSTPLNLRITASEDSERRRVLRRLFSLDNAEDLKPFYSSLLTIENSFLVNSSTKNQQIQQVPFRDGRLYVPDRGDEKGFDNELIKSNLKWEAATGNHYATELFLRHLALYISAQAAQNQVSELEWHFSYPSAFSADDVSVYGDGWMIIVAELPGKTGIKHYYVHPNESDEQNRSNHWRPESVVIAQYFADKENDLIYSTCIDIGGGTSDISIWQDNAMLHQCSIQFAGYDLMTQLLSKQLKLLQDIFKPSDMNNLESWKKLADNPGHFRAKLDVLLRHQSAQWLKNERDKAVKNAEFASLLQFMALGFAGLYYYVGIVLQVLAKNETYKYRNKITPIYLGGNGAKLLDWLSEGGRFDQGRKINKLLTAMLRAGSGFETTAELITTRVSRQPKDEAACGLVLDRTPLEGWRKFWGLDARRELVAGEWCFINKQVCEPMSFLPSQHEITDFEIRVEFEQLRHFLRVFNESVESAGIAGVKPLKYDNSTFELVERKLKENLLSTQIGKDKSVRLEPPFILVLKALLRGLSER